MLLSNAEKQVIQQNVSFVLIDKQYSVLKNVCFVSFFVAILFGWVFYGHGNDTLVTIWIVTMILIHIAALLLTKFYNYRNPKPENIKSWSYALRIGTLLSTLTYGSAGVLLVPDDPRLQTVLLSFFVVISSAVTLGTATDFLISVISISSNLIPFIVWQCYASTRYVEGLHLQTAGILTLFMIFLYAISYISYTRVKKSTELSFINVALADKLAEANNILEQRVEERTHELKMALEKVTFQSSHDILTGLPNQESLYEFLRQEMQTAQQLNYRFGVASFSINQAELLINSLGYKAWTTIVKSVAERLQYFCTAQTKERIITYTVALTRRDVFAIIVSPLQGKDEEDKVKRIFSVLSMEPMVIDNQEIKLSASIGVSIYPTDTMAAELLLSNADAAMYDSRKTKTAADNLLFYEPSVNARASRTMKLLNILTKAFYKQEFQLHYQPIVDLHSGEICGVEALSRWICKDIGFISPEEFIPLIQSSEIAFDYDEWVLRTACAQIKNWHMLGYKNLKVAVNLLEEFLQHRDMLSIIKSILKESDLQGEYLEIEFLESITFKKEILPNFNELRNMGVNISIDDFGKGQGDLEKIKAIPFNKIKIDRDFIKDVTENQRNEQIVKSAIDLGKRMSMRIVAEGVETVEQLLFLKKNGCDMVQGYLFSKPLPADEITLQLAAKKNIRDIVEV